MDTSELSGQFESVADEDGHAVWSKMPFCGWDRRRQTRALEMTRRDRKARGRRVFGGWCDCH